MKFLSLVCVLFYLCVPFKVHASVVTDSLKELGIVDQESFMNADTVSRKECIISIMRVIGVTDEEVKKLNGADLYTFADANSYSYEGCAYRGYIAYGEECIVDYPTYRSSHTRKNVDYFFFPDRTVTIKEALAFMVRCLEKTNNSEFDDIFDKARDYGIISNEDTFSNDISSEIKPNDFCILLERFLQQKRYKYYGRENNVFRMEGNIDECGSMTYFEMHNQR